MINQLNLDNLLITLRKQLRGIDELEKKIVQIDQIILQLRNKEVGLEKNLKNLTSKQYSIDVQKTALKKTIDTSKKAGFQELKRSYLLELKKIWEKEDPQLFQSFDEEEKKTTHFIKKFYMGNKDQILRIVGMDRNQHYHFYDITIPNNLTWEI